MAYALPQLYDELYAFKDYAGEAARLTELIRARNPSARTLLELFSAAESRRAFERAGLEVEHDPEGLIGRGLFIGRSPAG